MTNQILVSFLSADILSNSRFPDTNEKKMKNTVDEIQDPEPVRCPLQARH